MIRGTQNFSFVEHGIHSVPYAKLRERDAISCLNYIINIVK